MQQAFREKTAELFRMYRAYEQRYWEWLDAVFSGGRTAETVLWGYDALEREKNNLDSAILGLRREVGGDKWDPETIERQMWLNAVHYPLQSQGWRAQNIFGHYLKSRQDEAAEARRMQAGRKAPTADKPPSKIIEFVPDREFSNQPYDPGSAPVQPELGQRSG